MARSATVLEVASSSTPGKSYRVWVDATGPVFCDCPGHKYARGGARRECRHMRTVRESVTYGTAVEIATKGTAVAVKAAAVDRRIRFLEVQEETSEGTWTTVGDLRRFQHLEV